MDSASSRRTSLDARSRSWRNNPRDDSAESENDADTNHHRPRRRKSETEKKDKEKEKNPFEHYNRHLKKRLDRMNAADKTKSTRSTTRIETVLMRDEEWRAAFEKVESKVSEALARNVYITTAKEREEIARRVRANIMRTKWSECFLKDASNRVLLSI